MMGPVKRLSRFSLSERNDQQHIKNDFHDNLVVSVLQFA